MRDLLVFEEKDFVRDFYLLTLSQHAFEVVETKKLLQIIDDFSLPNFPINGEDLMFRGIKGKAVGEALSKAKEAGLKVISN